MKNIWSKIEIIFVVLIFICEIAMILYQNRTLSLHLDASKVDRISIVNVKDSLEKEIRFDVKKICETFNSSNIKLINDDEVEGSYITESKLNYKFHVHMKNNTREYYYYYEGGYLTYDGNVFKTVPEEIESLWELLGNTYEWNQEYDMYEI